MSVTARPATLKELRDSGWVSRTVKHPPAVSVQYTPATALSRAFGLASVDERVHCYRRQD